MRVSVNGREVELGEGTASVEALLAKLKYSVPLFVVTRNGSLVKREDFASTPVTEGDRVEVYNLVAGG